MDQPRIGQKYRDLGGVVHSSSEWTNKTLDAGSEGQLGGTTLQTAQPLSARKLTASRSTARGLVNELAQGDMTLDAPYQRGSVWTKHQRVQLIRSMILGAPVPSILIGRRVNDTWKRDADGVPEGGYCDAVIDGKQRLETLQAWFKGELQVPASWFYPGEIESSTDTADGPYVGYGQLTKEVQRSFGTGWTIPVVYSDSESIEDEAELYLLVNGSGTEQDEASLRRAAAVAQHEAHDLDVHDLAGLQRLETLEASWAGAEGHQNRIVLHAAAAEIANIRSSATSQAEYLDRAHAYARSLAEPNEDEFHDRGAAVASRGLGFELLGALEGTRETFDDFSRELSALKESGEPGADEVADALKGYTLGIMSYSDRIGVAEEHLHAVLTGGSAPARAAATKLVRHLR